MVSNHRQVQCVHRAPRKQPRREMTTRERYSYIFGLRNPFHERRTRSRYSERGGDKGHSARFVAAVPTFSVGGHLFKRAFVTITISPCVQHFYSRSKTPTTKCYTSCPRLPLRQTQARIPRHGWRLARRSGRFQRGSGRRPSAYQRLVGRGAPTLEPVGQQRGLRDVREVHGNTRFRPRRVRRRRAFKVCGARTPARGGAYRRRRRTREGPKTRRQLDLLDVVRDKKTTYLYTRALHGGK